MEETYNRCYDGANGERMSKAVTIIWIDCSHCGNKRAKVISGPFTIREIEYPISDSCNICGHDESTIISVFGHYLKKGGIWVSDHIWSRSSADEGIWHDENLRYREHLQRVWQTTSSESSKY